MPIPFPLVNGAAGKNADPLESHDFLHGFSRIYQNPVHVGRVIKKGTAINGLFSKKKERKVIQGDGWDKKGAFNVPERDAWDNPTAQPEDDAPYGFLKTMENTFRQNPVDPSKLIETMEVFHYHLNRQYRNKVNIPAQIMLGVFPGILHAISWLLIGFPLVKSGIRRLRNESRAH